MTKTIKNKSMFYLASDIVKAVSKNYLLPNKLTYDGVTYYILEYVYVMSYGIFHLKSDFKIPNFTWVDNTGDEVQEKISQEGYLDMAKRVYNFIVKNGKVPTNVRTPSGLRMPIKLYVYGMATCIQYYHNHQKLPENCNFDYHVFIKPTPKPQKKKYGHSKEHCCDDMGQNTPYYCACHSLQEVFRNLTGIVVSQSTIASVCGTTSAGTGHQGMNTCVSWFNRKYGYNLKVEWRHFSELGWNGIKQIVNSNNKDCIIHNLYRNQYGHYEVINKVYNDYGDVQNSLGSKCSNGCYYGYVEERYLSTFRSYINGISQKSVMVITNE